MTWWAPHGGAPGAGPAARERRARGGRGWSWRRGVRTARSAGACGARAGRRAGRGVRVGGRQEVQGGEGGRSGARGGELASDGARAGPGGSAEGVEGGSAAPWRRGELRRACSRVAGARARRRAGEEGAGAGARRAGGLRRGRVCALGTDTSAARARLRCHWRRLGWQVGPSQTHVPRASAPRGGACVNRSAAVNGGADVGGESHAARARLCRCARRSLRRVASVSAPLLRGDRCGGWRPSARLCRAPWRRASSSLALCRGGGGGAQGRSTACARTLRHRESRPSCAQVQACDMVGAARGSWRLAQSRVRGGQKDAWVLLHIASW